MDLTMEPEARAAFLADAHIGVFAVDRRDGPPLQTPLWYTYEPGGDVLVVTGAGSEKARLVTERGESSLCVQHDAAPYRFVTVSGPTVLEPVTLEVRRA